MKTKFLVVATGFYPFIVISRLRGLSIILNEKPAVLRNATAAEWLSRKSVNMQICSRCALGEVLGFAWKGTFALSIFKMSGLVLNMDKLSPLKWLFSRIV